VKREQKWRCMMGATALLVWIAVGGCEAVHTTQSGAVGVERRQVMSVLVTEADLRQGAEQAYAQSLAREQKKGALNADPGLTERVRTIAQRLIPVTAVFRPDAPSWHWDVNVIQSDQLNAWCMPGGKVAVYSGLITRLALTDDEIAAVLGHEIAHALREHARERASEQQAAGMVLGLGAAFLGVGQSAVDWASMAYKVAVGMPNSRAHETEADRMGVELAARAGFDPRAAISLWQKMDRQAGMGAPPQWLSTHPAAAARQRDLALYAERVLPFYQQMRR
jgi:predicted Zn-dependent protease